ncbi:MAG TPA: DUF1707 domain-containing protein [Actinocrinis sp.]
MSGSEPGPEAAAPTSGAEPRAGDAEREQAAEKLRVAAGDGRIDLAELEDRLEQAYRAKTYREIDALLADLPDSRPTAALTTPGPETMLLKTHGSTVKQNGRWTVPRRIVAEAGVPNIVIDFTEASCAHREVAIEASCGLGNIRLIVPRGWRVLIDGSSTNTSHIRNKAAAPPDPSAPTLTLIGHPRSGWISIRQPRR